MNKPTICVCIMCTNEENLIEQALTATLPYATDYIICDNESTDNTVKICQDFFDKHHVKGQIFHYQWYNLGDNYTYLYDLCYMYSRSDYFWRFDAEDEIHGDINFNCLDKDCYHLKINDHVQYDSMRLFKNTLRWQQRLKVHGYPWCVPTSYKPSLGIINGDYYLKSRHIGPVHQIHQKTKYLNNAKLLEEELDNKKLNKNEIIRCHYYLGQCYQCAYEYKEAIKAYKIRNELDGWCEENFICKFNIGICYEKLNKNIKALKWYIDSWKYRPTRSEGLAYASQLCRFMSLYDLAYKYAIMCKNIPMTTDHLFVNINAYKWMADFELSIVCFSINKKEEGLKACERLLEMKDLPNHIKDRTLNNIQFYLI